MRGKPFPRTHGMTGSPEQVAWKSMKQRCYYANARGFENYGGRGIAVCERWRSSFSSFYADMGARPSPTHSLDRIDVNGDYSPENCRWATPKEQNRNTRVNKLDETMAAAIRARFNVGDISKAALAREYGVTFMTITHVVRGEQWKPI